MAIESPATPAPAATPETVEQPKSNPPAAAEPAPATPPAPVAGEAGTVTLTTEAHANLKRQAARNKSRKGRTFPKPVVPVAPVDPDNQTDVALAEANDAREKAETRAMQAEIRGKVRDLLAEDRFKNIPQSTRDLVMKSPHVLSQADTLEGAMFEIENELVDIEETSKNENPPENPVIPNTPDPASTPNQDPPVTETPPVVTPGAPAPVDANVVEDLAGLTGPARSGAALRNTFKKAGIEAPKT